MGRHIANKLGNTGMEDPVGMARCTSSGSFSFYNDWIYFHPGNWRSEFTAE